MARLPPTRIERIVAKRMSEAKATIPDFSVDIWVDMSGCVQLRHEISAGGGAPPTLNDIIIKACASNLRQHPRVNASWRSEQFVYHDHVNVGFAVATDDGLVVPVILDADQKPLSVIASESRDLVARARSSALSLTDVSGATHTVSNLGMFGIDSFTAIVNPPQAAITAVGAVKDRPTAVNGSIAVRPQACIRMTCDHRILDGVLAAQFLDNLRDLLEHPSAVAA